MPSPPSPFRLHTLTCCCTLGHQSNVSVSLCNSAASQIRAARGRARPVCVCVCPFSRSHFSPNEDTPCWVAWKKKKEREKKNSWHGSHLDYWPRRIHGYIISSADSLLLLPLSPSLLLLEGRRPLALMMTMAKKK